MHLTRHKSQALVFPCILFLQMLWVIWLSSVTAAEAGYVEVQVSNSGWNQAASCTWMIQTQILQESTVACDKINTMVWVYLKQRVLGFACSFERKQRNTLSRAHEQFRCVGRETCTQRASSTKRQKYVFPTHTPLFSPSCFWVVWFFFSCLGYSSGLAAIHPISAVLAFC